MRRLGVVAIVFAGLLSVGQAIAFASTGARMLVQGQPAGVGLLGSLTFTFLSIVFAVAFGVALIALRNQLAAAWFDDEDGGWDIDGPTLLRVGLVLVGVTMVAQAIPATLLTISSAILQAAQFQRQFGDSPVSEVFWTGVASAGFDVVRLLIGVFIVARSRQLSEWLGGPDALNRKPRVEPDLLACPSCGAAYDPADYREGADTRCVECHAPLGAPDA